MSQEQRLITRSGFAKRLGLHEANLERRACSAVADSITCFYDLDGNCVGEHHIKHSPLSPWDDETFILYVDADENQPAMERMSA